jgi:hypothetical protein
MRIFDTSLKALVVLLLLASVTDASAQKRRSRRAPRAEAMRQAGNNSDSPPPPSPQGGESVLDFEGDVIEGQRRRPDLFLQTETQNLTLDAILYLRKDFNDFHSVERLRRPGYFERRKGEGL